MTRRNRALISLIALAVLSGAFSGCMRVIRHEAPYYKEGPHQVAGPDGFFEAGTHLWVFGEQDSYAKVLSMLGTAAHVWNQDLVSVREWSKLKKQTESGDNKVKMFQTSE